MYHNLLPPRALESSTFPPDKHNSLSVQVGETLHNIFVLHDTFVSHVGQRDYISSSKELMTSELLPIETGV